MHLYCALMACGDDCRTTKGRYLKILEFTHFAQFYSFSCDSEIGRKKELIRSVKVVVAVDLGWGTTNES